MAKVSYGVVAATLAGSFALSLLMSSPAPSMRFNPDACIDQSSVDIHRGDVEYRLQQKPGPVAPGRCPDYSLVPVT